jgi:hypothetical protein
MLKKQTYQAVDYMFLPHYILFFKKEADKVDKNELSRELDLFYKFTKQYVKDNPLTYYERKEVTLPKISKPDNLISLLNDIKIFVTKQVPEYNEDFLVFKERIAKICDDEMGPPGSFIIKLDENL